MQGKPLSLDLLALFLAVARTGTLDKAAAATGASAPTLSRKMAHLEREIGARLFERGRHGFALTAKGRALLQEAQRLDDVQAALHRFAARDAPTRVRITAGAWTAQFLARAIATIRPKDAPWVPEFLSAQHRLDIARREADIGIRNARPEQGWLSGQRTGSIDYACFASSPQVQGYIAVQDDGPPPPSARWVLQHGPDAIATRANDPRLACEMALSGLGRVVLPYFVGHAEPGLVQVGPAIPELSHPEWLVAHHDARHDPPIRAALDAISQVLQNRELRQCNALKTHDAS